MKAYKGFDKDLKCRGFQYEIGKEYEEKAASLCNRGFHACEHPLDCFRYYPPADSRFCVVDIDDNGERHRDDTKVCGKKIKIGAEIDIKGLIHAAFEYVKERCTNGKNGADKACVTGGNSSALTGGDCSALTGGDSSALTGGYRSALTGGNRSALTGGDRSALTGGNRSALTGGDRSALTGGYRSALTGGYRSALTGGNSSALTGGYSSALTGGNRSALTGGDCSALTGGNRSVVYGGEGARVRAGKGSVLALQYWKDFEFKCIKFKEVDGKKIKENTWYKLDSLGRFVEVKNNAD